MPAVWMLQNTRAGRPAYVPALARAAEVVARRGVDVHLEQAGNIDALQAAARQAVAAGAEAVLVAGGDGTLGTIAGELAGSGTALGCLPAGTANVWAQEMGLPRPSAWRTGSFERTTLALLDAPARPTDLGRCNGRWFLSWSGVGLDAYVTHQFEQRRNHSRRMGGYYYNVALTFAVARAWRSVELSARVSGPSGIQHMSGRYLMVTVANIGLHGGGLFRFTRDLRLDDGLMDVWAFAGETYTDMLSMAGRVVLGQHLQHPGVVRLTAERVELDLAAPHLIHIDGEPQPATQRMVVEVAPRALRMLVPAHNARGLYGQA